MSKGRLPPVFDEILDDPLNPLIEAAMAEGRVPIGYTCSFIPEALLSVDGLLPVRLRAPGTAGTPMADTYLSSVICPYPRSLLELTLEDRFDWLGGWVFAASCDHLRRLFDNLAYLNGPSFNHMVDVPHKRGPSALNWLVEELGLLAEALSAHFGVVTDSQALRASIARLNLHFELLTSIGELRRRRHPPISGTDFHKLMVAGLVAPRASIVDHLTGLLDELEGAEGIANEGIANEGIDDYRARLLVVGSGIDDPRYIEVIESMGGLVVADRFCFGSIPGLETISESLEPLRALAEHSLLRTRCPRMMEDYELRLRDILGAVDTYDVDGVVVETMKFCDLWGVESSPLVDDLREAGLPVLRLEREYTMGGEGQLRTRIQAFLESMDK